MFAVRVANEWRSRTPYQWMSQTRTVLKMVQQVCGDFAVAELSLWSTLHFHCVRNECVSQRGQYQGAGTNTAKWNAAMIHLINYNCVWQVKYEWKRTNSGAERSTARWVCQHGVWWPWAERKRPNMKTQVLPPPYTDREETLFHSSNPQTRPHIHTRHRTKRPPPPLAPPPQRRSRQCGIRRAVTIRCPLHT